jgi:manganese oxidase
MAQDSQENRLSRRAMLKASALGAGGVAAMGGVIAARAQGRAIQDGAAVDHAAHPAHANLDVMGDVDTSRFDPSAYVTRFETGRTSLLADGRTLREYDMVAVEKEIEVAPGVYFPAWAYNGQVPGPTLRCTEGDRLRVHFTNAGTHPHTIHFHGVHPANMDGTYEVVEPGQSYVYEFDAEPFGVHLYHCHVPPFKRHIHKGLYGLFIVDPKTSRAPAREFAMVMNGFDTNFDNDNEVYAVNTVAFHYQKHPLVINQGELVRVYLANLTEFDLLNSFHLHGNLFRMYRTGTNLDHFELTDTVMLCQGERAVLEFTYKHAGHFMFHAHQSEFAELGWSGVFDVRKINA